MNRHAEYVERVRGAVFGLLIGDAMGTPYEQGDIRSLPFKRKLEMGELGGRHSSYPVPTGTWSDDGAAALCLLEALDHKGRVDVQDAAARLYRWLTHGEMTVDGHVFDVGIQTSEALSRFSRGVPPEQCGLGGVRNNGNGSLMRVLPIALAPRVSNAELLVDAQTQSKITHAHPRSLVCCALYAMWARCELERPVGARDPQGAWQEATRRVRDHLPEGSDERRELERHVRPDGPAWGTGSSYVVDSLQSARWACQGSSYEDCVTRAISLGNDTDTTAALAGGIAGLRFGYSAIPESWRRDLRGTDLAEDVIERFLRRTLAPSEDAAQ